MVDEQGAGGVSAGGSNAGVASTEVQDAMRSLEHQKAAVDRLRAVFYAGGHGSSSDEAVLAALLAGQQAPPAEPG
jgi:hypothetical protein